MKIILCACMQIILYSTNWTFKSQSSTLTGTFCSYKPTQITLWVQPSKADGSKVSSVSVSLVQVALLWKHSVSHLVPMCQSGASKTSVPESESETANSNSSVDANKVTTIKRTWSWICAGFLCESDGWWLTSVITTGWINDWTIQLFWEADLRARWY